MGDVKFMEHKSKDRNIRLIMRRDKTHKICANHFSEGRGENLAKVPIPPLVAKSV